MRSLTVRDAIFATLLAASLAPIAHAQYVGPSTQKVSISIADILNNPVDNQEVVSRGFLISKVGTEKYLFSDGISQIRVEIDTEDFPAQKIDDKTHIEIRGEVEKDYLESPEIDVKHITILR
ncbi:NirD/YgiW/YdeI family stress tolerance protein [Actimicrobium antarcticum]|uniref:NirD/YgiW/YdeI family stress tolerance protein n=1 Tax=Actimicrobium antarcticum TaxID=1051899 RepID=A0ABP7U0L0_9BURK